MQLRHDVLRCLLTPVPIVDSKPLAKIQVKAFGIPIAAEACRAVLVCGLAADEGIAAVRRRHAIGGGVARGGLLAPQQRVVDRPACRKYPSDTPKYRRISVRSDPPKLQSEFRTVAVAHVDGALASVLLRLDVEGDAHAFHAFPTPGFS